MKVQIYRRADSDTKATRSHIGYLTIDSPSAWWRHSVLPASWNRKRHLASSFAFCKNEIHNWFKFCLATTNIDFMQTNKNKTNSQKNKIKYSLIKKITIYDGVKRLARWFSTEGNEKKATPVLKYRYWMTQCLWQSHKFSLVRTLVQRDYRGLLRGAAWELTRLDPIHWSWASATGFQIEQVHSCERAKVLCSPKVVLSCKRMRTIILGGGGQVSSRAVVNSLKSTNNLRQEMLRSSDTY